MVASRFGLGLVYLFWDEIIPHLNHLLKFLTSLLHLRTLATFVKCKRGFYFFFTKCLYFSEWSIKKNILTKFQTISSPTNGGRRWESFLTHFSFYLFTCCDWTISHIGPERHKTKHSLLQTEREIGREREREREPYTHTQNCCVFLIASICLTCYYLNSLPRLSTNKQHQVPNKPTWGLALPTKWSLYWLAEGCAFTRQGWCDDLVQLLFTIRTCTLQSE